MVKRLSDGDSDADLTMIREIVEDTLFSTQAAMILNLRTCVSSPTIPEGCRLDGPNSSAQNRPVRRLLLRNISATCHRGSSCCPGELCCAVTLEKPYSDRRTHFLPVPTTPTASLQWREDVVLDLSAQTRELKIRLVDRCDRTEQFLPGFASITWEPPHSVPIGQHILSVGPGQDGTPHATVTLELQCLEGEDLFGSPSVVSLRPSITPTKKVDVDRTIMPDGTIVTTVTTLQSRPKLDRRPGDSPQRSPSKVEVTEKGPTILPQHRPSSTLATSTDSPVSNGLDPVAETAIRQLTESACKVARKTPTKRSTLIISGVSKVPLAEDDSALTLGYAAAMDASLQGAQPGSRHQPDPDETTPSDASERPSVDDLESDTGSTGGLETRSLKDHKVGFLQSGTKLWFHRRHKEKETGFSQSHEDISNLGNNSVVVAASSRKTSGSFSRRLIKRFSFRSSGKSKSKASTTNGGANPAGN